ncbi:MAG: DUF262 domain-containing protein [Polyangiaceae bacterium]|nr:DUF262 domain-containing protein [Polyangiaceae bacterium]
MSTFDTSKIELSVLLDRVVNGRLQLPDFQRGWAWDDDHIRQLLVSVARSFPIGAIMLLQTGGEIQLGIRPVEGIDLDADSAKYAEYLILDGQQRLTSLAWVLRSNKPVETRRGNKRVLRLFYYFDIEKALDNPHKLEDAIVTVNENRQLLDGPNRKAVIDVSTRQKEIERFLFPCSRLMESDDWEDDLRTFLKDKKEESDAKWKRYADFRRLVAKPFRGYSLPVINLDRETSKHAVCLVFEKLNSAGMVLSAFDLITAAWSPSGVNLREDWYGSNGKGGIAGRLAKYPLLKDVPPTDFLRGLSLLHSYERRVQDINLGRSPQDAAGTTAMREDIVDLSVEAYHKWGDRLAAGFEEAALFLNSQGFIDPTFLPYRSQIIPLAAVLARIGMIDRSWREPVITPKLAQWFWCGVFGEVYGGPSDTRMAVDMRDLPDWLVSEKEKSRVPDNVEKAEFHVNRLDSLQTKISAAYRGLYVLLQRKANHDFYWDQDVQSMSHDGEKVEAHHIFPRKWCEDHCFDKRKYNSIVNKTPISSHANRIIGSKPPSKYLPLIQNDKKVKRANDVMDQILKSHLIDPALLRNDSFDDFYAARKAALLKLIGIAMAKSPIAASADSPVYEDDEDDT